MSGRQVYGRRTGTGVCSCMHSGECPAHEGLLQTRRAAGRRWPRTDVRGLHRYRAVVAASTLQCRPQPPGPPTTSTYGTVCHVRMLHTPNA